MAGLTTTVHRDHDPGVTLVRVRGTLSLVTAASMRATLLRCIAECPTAVVVDVSECVAENPLALTAFSAVAHSQATQLAVGLLLCGTDGGFAPHGAVALRHIPVYRTCAEAVSAAAMAASAQHRLRLRAGASRATPGRVRDAIAGACADWGLWQLSERAVLVASELVTNSVQHAGGEVDVEAFQHGEFFHLRVRDASPRPPVPVTDAGESPLRDHGRGLPIVDRLSAAWGYATNPDGSGKVVWATLRIRATAS